MLGHLFAGAAQGIGTGMVNDARSRHDMMLQELRENRADARVERQAQIASEGRRETAKLNSQTEIAREERGARQADRDQEDLDFQRTRQSTAKGVGGETLDPNDRVQRVESIYETMRKSYFDEFGEPRDPDSTPSDDDLWRMAQERVDSTIGLSGRPEWRGRGADAAPEADAPGGPSKNDILDEAIDALTAGAPRERVEAVLSANGIDPSRLPASPASAAPASASPAASQADRRPGDMAGNNAAAPGLLSRAGQEVRDLFSADSWRESFRRGEEAREQRAREAPSRELGSLSAQLAQVERDLERIAVMERDGTATPEEAARARARKQRQREMIEEQMMAADPERPR